MKISGNAFFLPFICTAFLFGCGQSNDAIKPDEANLNKATTMRNLYNKAGGDINKLSPADKATFDKTVGGSGKAAEVWAQLAPRTASLNSNGPTTEASAGQRR